jgi:hypothetical protein
MLLSQKLAHRILKDTLIISVDPKHIRYNVGTDRPLTKAMENKLKNISGMFKPFRVSAKLLAASHPLILSSSQFPDIIPIENIPKYVKVYDYIKNQPNYKNSLWYKQMKNQLRLNGIVTHKDIKMSTDAEVEEFFIHYVNSLIETISNEGYNYRLGPQLPTGMIAPDGEIYKSDGGNHRFAIAQCVGVSHFPLLIKCVHAEWLKSKGISPSIPNMTRLAISLQEVQKIYQTLE